MKTLQGGKRKIVEVGFGEECGKQSPLSHADRFCRAVILKRVATPSWRPLHNLPKIVNGGQTSKKAKFAQSNAYRDINRELLLQ